MSGESTSAEPWVDRPKPEGWPWIGWVLAGFGLLFFGVAIPAVLRTDLLFSLFFFGAATAVLTLIGSTILGLRYELTDSTLECRAGPSRFSWNLADIDRVQILDSHFARLQVMVTTQLMNRWNRPLLVVDRRGKRLLLGPTNPEEMRDEILRRRDRLRGDGGGPD